MEINEFIIYYQEYTQNFGVRRVTEILPSGSAPAAIVCEGATLWKAGWGSVSFPYGKEVERAIAAFNAYEGDYLEWSLSESPVLFPDNREADPPSDVSALSGGATLRERVETAELPLGYRREDGPYLTWWRLSGVDPEMPHLPPYRFERGHESTTPEWSEEYATWAEARASMEEIAPFAEWTRAAWTATL